jgi:uncharacterized C2H2 Zn-finger protein
MAQDKAFASKDYIEHVRSVHFTLIGVPEQKFQHHL